ncbi:hypothetical protein GCM10018952_44380 [Streptosporangium vulgare]
MAVAVLRHTLTVIRPVPRLPADAHPDGAVIAERGRVEAEMDREDLVAGRGAGRAGHLQGVVDTGGGG